MPTQGIDLDDLLKGIQKAGGPLQCLSFSHIEIGCITGGVTGKFEVSSNLLGQS
jgi:hypothetical protein